MLFMDQWGLCTWIFDRCEVKFKRSFLYNVRNLLGAKIVEITFSEQPNISSQVFLGRFHLIIPEIGISSSGRIILELMLPFHHLYQATSGLGFLQFLVGTFQLPGSRKICISFGHLEVEIGKTES